MKICNKCGTLKSLDQFSPARKGADGRHGTCRACRAEAAQQYRAEHPLMAREVGCRYRERYPERQRASERRWQAAHPESLRVASRRWRQANRNAVLDHYGRACACCGSADKLTVDHVNGDGKRRRQEHGRGTSFYRWLIVNGFPEGFQTLCSPCNRSKGTRERCRLNHVAAAVA